MRGIAYSYKGDDERALADYDLCLQLRPTYGSAYNNRGLIFMRRGELQRALDEFNLAVKHIFKIRAATCTITTGAVCRD